MKSRRKKMFRHILVGFVLVYFVSDSVMPMMMAQIRKRRGQSKMCPKSLDTMDYVTSCPNSIESWNNRSKEKNCASVKQNCGNNFVYHCLINEWENGTLEVCAVSTTIIGFACAEFNIGGTVIVAHYRLSCQHFQQPCPFRYRSVEAYKYPACFHAVQNKTSVLISTTESSVQEYSTNVQLYSGTTSSSIGSESTLEGVNILIAYVVIVVIIFVVFIKEIHKCSCYGLTKMYNAGGVQAGDEPCHKTFGNGSGSNPFSEQSQKLIHTEQTEGNNSTELDGEVCSVYKMWNVNESSAML